MAEAIVTVKVTPREFALITQALDLQAAEFEENRGTSTNAKVRMEWRRKYEEIALLRQRLAG